MKSVVNNKITKQQIGFPKLMINGDTIVLMSTACRGQVVNSHDSKYPVGYIGDDWRNFIDFDGSVTLSND